ncbi:hypothetical protein A7985_13655 [Pseudoalteromonas luteoviolacea]|uniref:OmpR/PhoB-type domain-containing protein n=1 Tax=Pseudoalteromonas luteoviolacea TaxID=43657 RepID=A0A1C0TPG3_9GAMM|nr:winged helix-turn-helix domain-containing protein [Pseudoalteromonas luteoviolacea]OCQ20837.1 hypothetical protein A7985_13655 [Pseudoalteromonas luteoviolacea]
MEHSRQYQLGIWCICPKTNSINSKFDTRTLDNKSMQLLLLLIQHAGNTVTKDEIFTRIWKDKFVTADILSVTISKIRKALDDDARNPSYIKTLPNEGYVLIAPVSEVSSVKPSRFNKRVMFWFLAVFSMLLAVLCTWYFTDVRLKPNSNPTVKGLNIQSIAVLPFNDLSVSQDNVYFTEGLSSAIIHQLAKVKQLKVISQDSSFFYRDDINSREIGEALNVEAILEGNIQTLGEQTRINVRVVSTQNNQLIWSQTFDSDVPNSFQLQDKISTAVRKALHPEFSSPTVLAKSINAQAYEWYLMGQYHWRQRTPSELNKAVSYFQHSLELEPDYAEAHIGLAISYAFLHTYGSWGELAAIDAALPHINKALALKPHSAQGLATLGMILSDKAKATGDDSLYQQARVAFTQSLQLERNATTHLWYSTLLTRLGHQEEAVVHLEQAIILNPLSAALKRSLSYLYKSMGKQNSADLMYQQVLKLAPNSALRPFERAKVKNHTRASVLAMAQWQVASPDLFASCASIEICEQQVLAYLSVGAEQVAEDLLDKMYPLHGHFRHSLSLIALGEAQNDALILTKIQNQAFRIPFSKEAHITLARAQFRAGHFVEAKNTLIQLYPHWQDNEAELQSNIDADNYFVVTLYAASLMQLNQPQLAMRLLNSVAAFLTQNHVHDKVQAKFVLAEVNAQLGNSQLALQHLTEALKMGWIESFNSQWWSLSNNHLLKPLHEMSEFQMLLKQHIKNRQELRQNIMRHINRNVSDHSELK